MTFFKKISGILLLIISILPVLLVLFFIYRKDAIRHHMKEELEKQILHSVTIKNNEIVWIKPGKEILVNGKMFDIKTAKEENGNTIFSGLYDEEETVLNNSFNSGWDKRNAEQNSPLTQFFHLLKGLYTQDAESNNDIFLPAHKFEEPCTPNLVTPFLSILTPPPEVLL